MKYIVAYRMDTYINTYLSASGGNPITERYGRYKPVLHIAFCPLGNPVKLVTKNRIVSLPVPRSKGKPQISKWTNEGRYTLLKQYRGLNPAGGAALFQR